tara:strand:+ start:2057 stop:2992 length:936 start_codon:yes stop_codon:yes gene_type:complete
VLKKLRKKIETKRKSKDLSWKSLVSIKDASWSIYITLNRIKKSLILKFYHILGLKRFFTSKLNYLFNSGKLPDFLIIGTQKAGTTSLWHHLKKHPQIEMTPNYYNFERQRTLRIKEVHFFDNNKKWVKGTRWYKSLFNNNSKLQGEATPGYIYFKRSHKRMFNVVPNAKLILILRNPIDQLYSAYNMKLKFNKNICEGFEKNLEKRSRSKDDLQIERGFFLKQIRHLLKYYNKDQLLILISEEMKKNPQKTYNKVFDFLHIKKIKIKYNPNIGKRKYKPMKKETRKKLAKLYSPHNEKLFKFLGYKIPEWK